MRLYIPRNVQRAGVLAGSTSKKRGWKGTVEHPVVLDVLPLGMGETLYGLVHYGCTVKLRALLFGFCSSIILKYTQSFKSDKTGI